MGHSFRLGVAVVEQPGLAFQRIGGIGVERFMPVEQDAALLVKKAEGRERHAREGSPRRERGVGPHPGPVGPHEDYHALRDAAATILPPPDVGDRQVIPGLLRDLVHDRDHHQRANRERWRELVDGRVLRAPTGFMPSRLTIAMQGA